MVALSGEMWYNYHVKADASPQIAKTLKDLGLNGMTEQESGERCQHSWTIS